MTEQPTPEPYLTPQPNKILAAPATVQACASDLRTPDEQDTAAGLARDQLAHTREAAAHQAATPGRRH